MATNFEYDHAHYLARREIAFQNPATASAIGGFWVPEFDCTLMAIKAMSVIAGTHSNNSYTFAYGTATTAITTLLASNLAMFSAVSATPGLALSAGQAVWAVKGNEATGAVAITYEYKVTPLSNATS